MITLYEIDAHACCGFESGDVFDLLRHDLEVERVTAELQATGDRACDRELRGRAAVDGGARRVRPLVVGRIRVVRRSPFIVGERCILAGVLDRLAFDLLLAVGVLLFTRS